MKIRTFFRIRAGILAQNATADRTEIAPEKH
jgi:hypothetical protein